MRRRRFFVRRVKATTQAARRWFFPQRLDLRDGNAMLLALRAVAAVPVKSRHPQIHHSRNLYKCIYKRQRANAPIVGMTNIGGEELRLTAALPCTRPAPHARGERRSPAKTPAADRSC